ncbi:hypothetical protein NZD89_14335 [Alicyclobacillus fastidiosus]|uniref:Uncharacterized protein n=1 Tax=Alicyclobacillus fastidiosus TaxID=392011 RepID=A0ABY6Z9S0_9BACL|nr:hypothetical protein [Alicyclobacillus fastidiosus]WAH39601.1 hypothetical protein NZD89_14335 [Alicyclobacillus fastidiosus]GMA60808.1 hypothetical protein GCM10025859_12480 [Alicyclobacillus fastidiosus]
MSNRRIINGQDTPARIEEIWNYMVDNDKYYNVTEFARRAKISPTTFCHRYREWAEKVRARRDRRYGKRKRSPVTLKRVETTEFKQALEQIKELQRTVGSLRSQLSCAEKQVSKLLDAENECKKLEAENRKLRGAVELLLEHLQMAGVTQEKLMTIWSSLEKQIQVVR